jgi:mono/diheme cytochrome c family protein
MSAPKLQLPPMGPLPRWVAPALAILIALSFVPLAMIARTRATHTAHPRLQIIPDMDQQPKFKPQSANALFADGRAMRLQVEGTVARGQAELDAHLSRGLAPAAPGAGGGRQGGGGPVSGTVSGTAGAGYTWAESFPFALTPDLVKRGQERYNIYCAPCHGLAGGGDGLVQQRADRLQEGPWVPPANLASDLVRGRPAGHIYNTITNGIRNMPAYGPQIPERDRWAIVAYVRALQRSQHAPLEDVPPELRGALR